MESSRTHFEVLGLEVLSPRKLPFPRLEDSTIFEPLKFRWKTPETLRKIYKDLFLFSSSRDCVKKKIFEDLFRLKKTFEDFFVLFLENTCFCVLGLGLERVCPWPWPRNFFVSLALASRGFVLGLGHEIFLCHWPWPRALCPRLHLC